MPPVRSGVNIEIPSDPSVATPNAIIIGSTTIIADTSNRLVIEGKTLIPGGAITIGASVVTLPDGHVTQVSGTRLVLEPGGTRAVLGSSSTLTLIQASPTQFSDPEVVVQILNQLFTVLADGTLVTGQETIAPGSVALIGGNTYTMPDGYEFTLGGTQISFDAIATRFVIVGTGTIELAEALATAVPHQTMAITVVGEVYTILDNKRIVKDGSTVLIGDYTVLGGSTLTSANGRTTVVGGTTVSLAPGGTAVVINGVTTHFAALQAKSTPTELLAGVAGTVGTTATNADPVPTTAPLPSQTGHESGQPRQRSREIRPLLHIILALYLLCLLR